MENQKRRLDGIDLFKFILAFFVIAIHAYKTENMASFIFVDGICRVAVPFYFIVSGYFCFRKKNIEGYLKSIITLYLVWTVIYLPVIINGMITDNPKGHSAAYVIIRWIILQFSLSGSYFHLWYINATFWGVLIVYILLKVGIKPKGVLIISAAVYLAGLLGQSYHGLIAGTPVERIFQLYCKVFSSTRNGLFIGFPFIAMGAYISEKHICMPVKKSLPLFFIGIALLIFEVLFTRQNTAPADYNSYIFLPLCAFALFMLSLNIESATPGKYRPLRDISVITFFVHMYVLMGINSVSSAVLNPPVRYLTVSVVSLAVSLAIYRLSKRFKPLRYLYA